MERADLESDCLAHIDERYYLGAYCRRCQHRARLSVTVLRQRLGAGFRLRKLRERLKCERCGDRRQIVVTLFAPDEGGSVSQILKGPVPP